MRTLLISACLLLAAPAWSVPADLLFFEDFNDNTADGFTPVSGTWECLGGEYYYHVEGVNQHGLSVFGSVEWADYRVEWDQLITAGCGAHKLLFRMQSLFECYLFGVRAEPFNDFWLYRMNGGPLELEPLANGSISFTIGEWHHFMVAAEGPYISGWADNIHLFTIYRRGTRFAQRLPSLECLVCYSLKLDSTRASMAVSLDGTGTTRSSTTCTLHRPVPFCQAWSRRRSTSHPPLFWSWNRKILALISTRKDSSTPCVPPLEDLHQLWRLEPVSTEAQAYRRFNRQWGVKGFLLKCASQQYCSATLAVFCAGSGLLAKDPRCFSQGAAPAQSGRPSLDILCDWELC